MTCGRSAKCVAQSHAQGRQGIRAKECHSSVTGLPAPLRVLCHLTRGNQQPCHPVGGRRVTTARLAGQETDGRASQAVALPASAVGGCRAACARWMSAMRKELHHLVDVLPGAGLRPAPGLIRPHAAGDHGRERNLPFSASSEAGPGLAERAEEILLRHAEGPLLVPSPVLGWARSGTSSSRGRDRRLR
jgi:hypothetical protein